MCYATRDHRHTIYINASDANGQTALHHAAINGHVDIMITLVEHGADPEILDVHGKTALEYMNEWALNHPVV
jgi:ankyrin repeat protein